MVVAVNFKFQELGLLPGTPVGTSLIDAHAGGVGVMESIPDSVMESIPILFLDSGLNFVSHMQYAF